MVAGCPAMPSLPTFKGYSILTEVIRYYERVGR